MKNSAWLKVICSCLRNSSRSSSSNCRRRRFRGLVTSAEVFECRVLLSSVKPYLQNPAPDAMTVIWFTETNTSGTLTVNLPAGGTQILNSTPEFKSELAYHPSEAATSRSNAPWMHRIRVTGLTAGTSYDYTVTQAAETFTGQIRTSPNETSDVRFIVYADSETEPESTGSRVVWTQPGNPGSTRQYVADQTVGYSENLKVIESRVPDFIGIAGDLVESGGEQRDWDEFWRHNAGDINDIASRTPILAAPGNHEVYGGPGSFGGYSDAGSVRAQSKFKTYWEAPSNGTSAYDDRYYRIDYGPITYISLDVTNGQPHSTSSDTNWLLGDGPGYPDFNPGSIQYQWLETQLADAQTNSRFTFVQFHHAPYSTGPHGYPAGTGAGFDNQSGVPVRVLTPLFVEYGVDAVFSGHDETYQHSLVDGIHFWDIGIGGDGLRGPSSGPGSANPSIITNPYQQFTAHLNAPEVWNGLQLVSGGKHYGHMEINVSFDEPSGTWKAKLDPVYVFPLMNAAGTVTGWERRIYNDTTTLTANAAPTSIAVTSSVVPENQPSGTPVGLLSSLDAVGNTHTYILVTGAGDADNSSFTIVGDELQTTADFDFETQSSYTIRVRSTDQGGLAFEQILMISVSNVPESDPPLIGSFDTPVAFRENGVAVLLDTNATITDADSANFAGGVLTASLVADAEAGDQLLIRDQGVGAGKISLGPGNTVTYSGAVIGNYTGGTSGTPLVVAFATGGSKTAAQALIRNLTFIHSSNAPLNPARTVQLQLTDGDGGTSAAVTKIINVTAVNDVPVIASFGDPLSYTEDGPPIIVTTGATISDVDSINFDTGKLIVRVLINAHASDRIAIRHQGTDPGQIGISGTGVTYGGTVIGTFTGTSLLTVTLNANADSVAVQALLREITFQNISQAPSILTRTISATLNDGDGGTSLAVSKTVAVTALNDDPVIGAFDTAITYTENVVPVLLDSNATVIDPDLKDFDGGILTVSLTANGHADDRLAIRNQGITAGLIGITAGSVTFGGVAIGTFIGGISGTDPLIVTFNTTANQAAVQALVRNLTFRNISENPAILPRTVQVQLTDGDGGSSLPVTKIINVTAVNDAPVVSGFADSVAYFILGAPVIVDSDATISDVDSSNFDTGRLTVSLTTNKQTTDRLSVASVGDGPGQIRTAVNSLISSLKDVFYEGVLIGTYPVASTTTLAVTLNANSSSTGVAALLRRVTFYSISATPSTALRTVRVLLNDGDGRTSIVSAKSISVTENLPPILAVIDNQSVVEGNELTFTASATDSDLPAQSLTYSLDLGAPASASINASTGLFSWTPAESDGPGSFSVTVRVTDSIGASDSQVVAIQVQEPVVPAVTIDGDFSDWSFFPSYTDPADDQHDTDHDGPLDTPAYVNHPDVDLLEFKITHDEENFYFYFRSSGEIGNTQMENGELRAGRYYAIVTIDVDNDDATGYDLHEGGYYPTTDGYDMNAELEFYNGAINTGHYLQHGAANDAELEQAFSDQSNGQYVWNGPATQGPFTPGFVNVLPGTYDYYTQWVYKENDPGYSGNDSVTFVSDKGPVIPGIVTHSLSPDGHKLEMRFPFKGFLKNAAGDSIVQLGQTVDFSFSLEASGELSNEVSGTNPNGKWASDTGNPIVGYVLTDPSQPASPTALDTFVAALDEGSTLPTFDRAAEGSGEVLRVNTEEEPVQTWIWQATNKESMDFRIPAFGPDSTSPALTNHGAGQISHPASDGTARVVERIYNIDKQIFTFTTEISTVTPLTNLKPGRALTAIDNQILDGVPSALY